MFEIVDDRQTDAQAWIYYKLTYEPSAQVEFCPFILKILSKTQILGSIKSRNSVANF